MARLTWRLVVLVAWLRTARTLSLASARQEPIATVHVMPNPVTEAACLTCKQNITDMERGIQACNVGIAMLDNVSADAIADLKIQRANFTSQDEIARAEVDALQRSLLRSQGRTAPLYDELGAQTGGVVGATLTLASVHRQEPDYVGQWLRCNTRRHSVELWLNACYLRLLSERRRHAAREAQYAWHATRAQAALSSSQAQRTLVAEALNKTDAENQRVAAHIESLRNATALR
mmetsp:Transcript_626/g.1768  ORF Transcript_626/g.1768 Transcript_626/m.1768 type:complete len:233 (+) Transcript_626:69-767(+)